MAEKLSSENKECDAAKGIPSNEEIIEEVMRGVEDCLIVEPDEHTRDKVNGMDFVKSEHTTSEQNGGQSNKSEPSENTDSAKMTEGASEESTAACDEDDFVDELNLKDMEDTYSDVEKEQRRIEAERHKTLGNDNFKSGEYRESVKSYTVGLRTCPLAYPKERAILYSNRAAAKTKLDLKPSAIEDCTKAIELDPSYLKARYRRAQLYEETDKLDEALVDYQEILKLDPLHREALYATKRLPEKINDRNEKMKAEMFAKLKDLGNMILRPFNLSTDNFQVNQDPNTGGYSINFKPNSQQ